MRLPIDNEVMPQEDSAEVDVSELMEKLLKTRKQAFADVDQISTEKTKRNL